MEINKNIEFINKYISCFCFKEHGRMNHLKEYGSEWDIFEDFDKDYEKIKELNYLLEDVFYLLIEVEDVNKAIKTSKKYLKYTKTHNILNYGYNIKDITENFVNVLLNDEELKSPEIKNLPEHLKGLKEFSGKKIMEKYINLEIKFLENIIETCDEDDSYTFKNFKKIIYNTKEFYNESNYYATIKGLGEYLGEIKLHDHVTCDYEEFKNIEFTIDYVIYEFTKETYSEIE